MPKTNSSEVMFKATFVLSLSKDEVIQYEFFAYRRLMRNLVMLKESWQRCYVGAKHSTLRITYVGGLPECFAPTPGPLPPLLWQCAS
jgi:hypothetical protein